MFSKSFLASAVALCLALQVSAHAAVNPALGVKNGGKTARSDVQRPSNGSPCGRVNVAQNIDTSTAVTAGADGSISVTGVDFNAGGDGSRSFSATVDVNGSGKFVAMTVTKNGNAKPASVGSEQLTAKLPAGAKCTGGKSKNKCIVSFKSTAGFGNCVVVQQGGKAQNNLVAAAPAAAPAADNKAATDKAAADAKAKADKAAADKKTADKKAADAKAAADKKAADKKAADAKAATDNKAKDNKAATDKAAADKAKADKAAADKKAADAKKAAAAPAQNKPAPPAGPAPPAAPVAGAVAAAPAAGAGGLGGIDIKALIEMLKGLLAQFQAQKGQAAAGVQKAAKVVGVKRLSFDREMQ